MNDQTQNNQSQNQTANNQQVQQHPPMVQPPHAPAGSVHKERGPVNKLPAEYIGPSIPEVKLPVEVEKTGVEVSHNPHMPQITQSAKIAGVDYAKETVPVITQPTNNIQLPYTYDQTVQIEETRPFWDSARWLAKLTQFLMKQLGLIQASR